MKVLPKLNEQDIVQRYTSGDSIRTIARALGVSYGAIRNRLQKNNVELRKQGSTRDTKAGSGPQ